MKSLISVFNYSPDYERKEILHNLLLHLQTLRDKFDILVVSHSSISELSLNLIDYFYYDKNNELITDFDLTNKFWFRCSEFAINSSLVYPVSTHLAIYNLLYYTFNFAQHKKYNKIHFIEFDIQIEDFDLITQIDDDLNNNDAVMFRGDGNWILGVYFASTLNGFDHKTFEFERNKILEQLSQSDNRMTERVTPVLLCTGRKVKFREANDINNTKGTQINDVHNHELKWSVPVVIRDTEELCFFTYNETGKNYRVDVLVDDIHYGFNLNQGIDMWNLLPIGNITDIKNILIFVDKKMVRNINFNEENLHKFKENNFLTFLNNEN